MKEYRPLDGIVKYHSFEQGGPLALIMLRNSFFATAEALKVYVDFYEEQRDEEPD